MLKLICFTTLCWGIFLGDVLGFLLWVLDEVCWYALIYILELGTMNPSDCAGFQLQSAYWLWSAPFVLLPMQHTKTYPHRILQWVKIYNFNISQFLNNHIVFSLP